MQSNKNKILIVEDENIIALDIKTRLTKLGYLVTEIVNSGEKAVEAALKLKPDLILMDISLKGKMSGIDAGIEICKYISVPIIYLTAFFDVHILLNCADCKLYYDYIIKPFDPIDLKNKIQSALAA